MQLTKTGKQNQFNCDFMLNIAFVAILLNQSWLFEEFNREEAVNALQNQIDGTFLVRPSSTIKGDLVLCVKYVLKKE